MPDGRSEGGARRSARPHRRGRGRVRARRRRSRSGRNTRRGLTRNRPRRERGRLRIAPSDAVIREKRDHPDAPSNRPRRRTLGGRRGPARRPLRRPRARLLPHPNRCGGMAGLTRTGSTGRLSGTAALAEDVASDVVALLARCDALIEAGTETRTEWMPKSVCGHDVTEWEHVRPPRAHARGRGPASGGRGSAALSRAPRRCRRSRLGRGGARGPAERAGRGIGDRAGAPDPGAPAGGCG